MSPTFDNKPDLDLFPPDPATVAAEKRAQELEAELKRRDSQPPKKNGLEEEAVAPAPLSLAGANTIKGTLKDFLMVLSAAVVLVGIYYGFQGSIAKAEENASRAIAGIEVLDRRLNRHDTDLKVIEEKAQFQAQDLDRRFGEVKQGQVDMEKRLLDALREVKLEIRRK